MTTVLILGKRGGILRWFEHLLAAQAELPDVRLLGRALNHEHLGEQLLRRLWGKESPRYEGWVARDVHRLIRRHQPQLILIADRYYLHQPLLEVLGSQLAPVVQWIGDTFDERLAGNRCVKEFLMTDSAFVEDAARMGLCADYLPLAVNPQQYQQQQPWLTRNSELLLVAAHAANRESAARQIRCPLHIIGKGWPTLPTHRVDAHNISQQKLADLYGSHQQVLNLINRNNVRGGLNMRCFEAPAAGACLVSEHVADLTKIFTPGETVIAFDEPAALAEQLASLPPARREAIARAGQRLVLSAHTYSHRLRELIARHAG